MIPKVIHYCWFGGQPLPPLAIKCIESWKKHAPEYEIKEWNESNFDINIIPYTAEAYKQKKYAFVSDYARFWIIYNYGGVYFDTDVELIKSIDGIVAKGPFMGCETKAKEFILPVSPVNAGLGIGCYANHPLYKEILSKYENTSFCFSDKSNQETVVSIVSAILANHGLTFSKDIQSCCNIFIYPEEYFCPLSPLTNKLSITENSISIHHYAASWTKKAVLEKIWKKFHLPDTAIRYQIKKFFKKL